MSKKTIQITELNISEWIHSTGYLLPRTDVEHARFDLLYSNIERRVTDDEVDPIKILRGIWKSKPIVFISDEIQITSEINELRMAARNHAPMPEHILNKIKKNHSNDSSDSTDN